MRAGSVFGRKDELSLKYGIPIKRLDRYKAAGLLTPIHRDGDVLYADLRVAVLAKAEKLGFSFEEIISLLQLIGRKPGESA